jgi:nucleoside-diphosphate-sugar epimerase
MRVFVAGAAGALGRPLVRELVSRGHEVYGLTRTPARRALIESLGARAVVADALDGEGLRRAVVEVRPTHVVHLLTALPPAGPLRASQLDGTNRLRTEGTRNLIAAARAAGTTTRIVAESFVGVYGDARFDTPQDEDATPASAPAAFQPGLEAMRSLESQVLAAKDLSGVVLRIGYIYGPEVASTLELVRLLRAGQMFYPRGGSGVGSFIHVDDAAQAIRLALEAEATSLRSRVYNVVDDAPMPPFDFMTLVARSLGVRAPRRVPGFLLRLLAPLVVMFADARLPLSNARLRRELGFSPRYPDAARGVAATLSAMKTGAAAA